MIKTVNGIEYITVPEEKSGYCISCVAEEDIDLCKKLQTPGHCQDIKHIFKKKENIMKTINQAIIWDTAYSILSAKLEDKVKSEYSIDDLDELISTEIDNIGNYHIKDFVEHLVDDVTDDEKIKLHDEIIDDSVDNFLKRVASYDVVKYYGIKKVVEVAEDILIEELNYTLIDEKFEEFKNKFFDSVYEDIIDKEVLNSIKVIFNETSEEVMKKVICDLIRKQVHTFISDNF